MPFLRPSYPLALFELPSVWTVIIHEQLSKEEMEVTPDQSRAFNIAVLTAIFMAGLWTVDVGASALANGLQVGTLLDIRGGLVQYLLMGSCQFYPDGLNSNIKVILKL